MKSILSLLIVLAGASTAAAKTFVLKGEGRSKDGSLVMSIVSSIDDSRREPEITYVSHIDSGNCRVVGPFEDSPVLCDQIPFENTYRVKFDAVLNIEIRTVDGRLVAKAAPIPHSLYAGEIIRKVDQPAPALNEFPNAMDMSLLEYWYTPPAKSSFDTIRFDVPPVGQVSNSGMALVKDQGTAVYEPALSTKHHRFTVKFQIQ